MLEKGRLIFKSTLKIALRCNKSDRFHHDSAHTFRGYIFQRISEHHSECSELLLLFHSLLGLI